MKLYVMGNDPYVLNEWYIPKELQDQAAPGTTTPGKD